MTELLPCPFCGSKIYWAEPTRIMGRTEIRCDSCGCNVSAPEHLTESHWNTRHIIRADIPESLIAEIKAEALEKLHGKYGHKTLQGVVIYGEAVLYEAAKLREQKDEII